MKHTGLGGILALLLCLGLVSLEARGDDLQRFLAQMQSDAASRPVARQPAKPSGVTGEKAYCQALCGGGTTVSVNCSSCTAVDQNCSVNQPGYVQCSGDSPVYCPSPCKAACTAQCQDGTTVSVGCKGTCTRVDQACPYEQGYAQCNDGDKVYCPSACQPICHANVACPDGSSVSCEGFDYCESRPGSCAVLCDGIFSSCPWPCS